jgi:hypothetical protein
MKFDIVGKIIVINETETFGANGFQKREFVVEVEDGNYPQKIKFELVKDKTNLIDEYRVGQKIKVHFNIRGSEYNGKYYTSLSAWRLEGGGGSNSSGGSVGNSDGNRSTRTAGRTAPRSAPKPTQDVADEDVPW